MQKKNRYIFIHRGVGRQKMFVGCKLRYLQKSLRKGNELQEISGTIRCNW